VQERLRRRGASGVRVDGVFGPQTRAAVIDLQRAYHLVPDGVVGPLTWDRLWQ
jgi:peptidoglycan hydrolase-like protein with peptidoglycan-binding domain